MAELLLLSNSTAPGMGFLEHALGAVQEVLGGRTSALFVPFASSDPAAYTAVMRDALGKIDLQVRSLHEADDVVGTIRDAEAVFVGTGRLFRRHAGPADIPVGADLSFLLDSKPCFDAGTGR